MINASHHSNPLLILLETGLLFLPVTVSSKQDSHSHALSFAFHREEHRCLSPTALHPNAPSTSFQCCSAQHRPMLLAQGNPLQRPQPTAAQSTHEPEPKRTNKMSSSHFILYTFLFLTHLIKKRFSGTIRVYLSIFKYKSHLSPVPKQLKANMAISIEKCSEKCFLVGILQLQDKMVAQWSQHSVVPHWQITEGALSSPGDAGCVSTVQGFAEGKEEHTNVRLNETIGFSTPWAFTTEHERPVTKLHCPEPCSSVLSSTCAATWILPPDSPMGQQALHFKWHVLQSHVPSA